MSHNVDKALKEGNGCAFHERFSKVFYYLFMSTLMQIHLENLLMCKTVLVSSTTRFGSLCKNLTVDIKTLKLTDVHLFHCGCIAASGSSESKCDEQSAPTSLDS